MISTIGKVLTFDASGFGPHERDCELVNYPNMHGYALAQFIAERLPEHGFVIDRMVADDWGWWVGLVNPGFELSYGCSSYEGAETFLIVTIPDKPFVRKIFRKFDVADVAERLDRAIEMIVGSAPGLIDAPRWEEG